MDKDFIYERVKAFFKIPNNEGQNVYDHLVNLLTKIYVEEPKDPYESFEFNSEKIKKNYNKNSNIKKEIKYENDIQENVSIEILRKQIEGTEFSCFPFHQIYNISELLSIIEIAGVNFCEIESLIIQIAIQKFIKSNTQRNVRFWGKILGIFHDYYILEVIISEPYEQKIPNDSDDELKIKKNIEYDYYYFINLDDPEFIKLPAIDSNLLKKVQGMKKLLKGDPTNKICINFPGNESDYLRSLIEIISSETIIDIASVGDEESVISQNKLKSESNIIPDPYSLKSWVYTRGLNHTTVKDSRNSRTNSSDSFDKLENITEVEESNKSQTRGQLYELTIDSFGIWKKPIQCKILSPITLREKQYYILKNLTWQGAITIYYEGQVVNFYVGNGIRTGSEISFPPIPLTIMEDPIEPQEQNEPQPEIELESDGENYIS